MAEKIYTLERVYLADRTLGSWYGPDGGLVCKTLELPWKDNARKISCIKEGIYPVTYSDPVLADDPNTEKDESGGRQPRPYAHYIVHRVPGRSGILVHKGYNPAWSQGCILVSGSFANNETDTPTLEIDGGRKLKWMTETLERSFKLRILSKSGIPYK